VPVLNRDVNATTQAVVGQSAKKLPDPSRKAWDGSASTKPSCIGEGCIRRPPAWWPGIPTPPAKTELSHNYVGRAEAISSTTARAAASGSGAAVMGRPTTK
jgi:hypothetical protein